MAEFLLGMRLARHELHESDDRGAITLAMFEEAFEKFPWVQEIMVAKTLNKGAPGLTVRNSTADATLSVSASHDGKTMTYQVTYQSGRRKFLWLRWGNPPNSQVKQVRDPTTVLMMFRHFFREQARALETGFDN